MTEIDELRSIKSILKSIEMEPMMEPRILLFPNPFIRNDVFLGIFTNSNKSMKIDIVEKVKEKHKDVMIIFPSDNTLLISFKGSEINSFSKKCKIEKCIDYE